MCPFCPHKIETEFHCIFICNAYTSIRTTFLPQKFIDKANLQTLKKLLSNENYQIHLAKYLNDMFRKRKSLLDST